GVVTTTRATVVVTKEPYRTRRVTLSSTRLDALFYVGTCRAPAADGKRAGALSVRLTGRRVELLDFAARDLGGGEAVAPCSQLWHLSEFTRVARVETLLAVIAVIFASLVTSLLLSERIFVLGR